MELWVLVVSHDAVEVGRERIDGGVGEGGGVWGKCGEALPVGAVEGAFDVEGGFVVGAVFPLDEDFGAVVEFGEGGFAGGDEGDAGRVGCGRGDDFELVAEFCAGSKLIEGDGDLRGVCGNGGLEADGAGNGQAVEGGASG